MNVSLFQAAAAMNASNRWQELIAENLSASSIPGFKKQELSFSTLQSGLMPASSAAPQHFVLPRATAATNFQPGQLKHTGVKTDVAIEGAGFFSVQLPNGATAFTRDGEFQVNAQGQLVTKQGYAVLGDSGAIQLDPANVNPITISGTGEISQGTDLKAQIKVVDFSEPQLLTPISGGYFLASHPNLQSVPVPDANLRQGYLENANTSAVAEMVHLIVAMRTFEANQRVIQAHDERMAHAISEIGNLN